MLRVRAASRGVPLTEKGGEPTDLASTLRALDVPPIPAASRGTRSSGTMACVEERLPGGNLGGAVLVDGTVRRRTGPWTDGVHALLRHLEAVGFEGAPRPLGFDERGREILSYLAGETVGDRKPWPHWVHSEAALVDVGAWLRRYHLAAAGFTPPPSARWRLATHSWQAGDVIGHNDAAPYNAVWRPNDEGLVGFIDWDFAAPCPPIVDLAFTVCAWVPLHARDVAAAEGFTDFEGRARRLRVLLDAYGFSGSVHDVLSAVREQIARHIEDVRNMADAGDPLFRRLVALGTLDDLRRTQTEFEEEVATLRGA